MSVSFVERSAISDQQSAKTDIVELTADR